MREPRTRVMIAVEVSWADQGGSLQSVAARMENKSEGGACIRVGRALEVGSKVGIRGRWEKFLGTAKYCIADDGAYLVGIQRDTKSSAATDQVVATVVPLRGVTKGNVPAVPTAKAQNLPQLQEKNRSATAPTERKVEKEAIVQSESRTTGAPPRVAKDKMQSRPGSQEPDGRPGSKPQANQLSKEEETDKKRKRMRRNWFGITNKSASEHAPGGNETGNGANGNRPLEAEPAGKVSTNSAGEDAADFPVELMQIEDIYRTSGIRSPRKDYGINKVIEMLRSEHVRDLPNEMKRAAVLMALDAAGIPIDEVLRDAKARQDALDSYEAERKTQMEAEWARKAKENAQILAELEGLKLHHMACINRNLDRIVREKATFGEWLAMKNQESQNITDAAELCLKSRVAEPTPDSPPGDSAIDASAKAAPVSLVVESREKTPR